MKQTGGFSLTPSYDPSPFRPLINIGAGLDIPTGTYVTGLHGESLLNAGLGMLVGVAGIGNNFKSGVLHYMNFSAMSRITYAQRTSYAVYDTEINLNDDKRMLAFAKGFQQLAYRNLSKTGELHITNRGVYRGNKWFEEFKKWTDGKIKSGKQWERSTPFVENDGKTPFNMLVPTFGGLDSLSEFDTDDISKLQDDNEIGESGGNMLHMKHGSAKTRLLMELPVICTRALHFLGITAQLGKDIPMASGPYAPPPTKKLNYLKHGDKLKGVSDKFFFLMSTVWHAYNMTPLIDKESKGPMYPLPGDKDSLIMGTDLQIVTLRVLRCKTGPTGSTVELVVSQRDGVLATLSEFHNCKTNERYGIDGAGQHYAMDLYPDVKLQRTTMRERIDEDAKLRRAINITSELLQMSQYWTHLSEDFLCTPKVLYEDLKKKGYDWDELLQTRGWWTLDNDDQPIPFLSTRDLLNMRVGKYTPYWMGSDKKRTKKYKYFADEELALAEAQAQYMAETEDQDEEIAAVA